MPEENKVISFGGRAVRPTDAGPMHLRWSNGHSRSTDFWVQGYEQMEEALMNAIIDYRGVRQPKRPLFVADTGGGAQRKTDVEARYPGQFVVAVGNGNYDVWPTWADFEYHREYRGNPSELLELHVGWNGRWTDPLIWGYTHVINSPRLEPDREGRPSIRGTDPVLIIGPGRWHGEILWRACATAEDAMRQFDTMCNMVSLVLTCKCGV